MKVDDGKASCGSRGGFRGTKEPPFATLMYDFGQFLDKKEAWWP